MRISNIKNLFAYFTFTALFLLHFNTSYAGEYLQIAVEGANNTVVFQLNNSPAALSLYNQLPLEIKVENYGHNEKIFYPPKRLDTSNGISVEGPAGTLAYFAPWGNVVMFYSSCDQNSSLYKLGEAISGVEHIENLSGNLKIRAVF